MNLVYHMIHKHYPTFIHNEDVIQEGFVGLCNAARLWDETKSKFTTYAGRSIVNQIRMYFKREMKQPDTLSLDLDVKSDEGSTTVVHEIIPDTYTSSMYDIVEFDTFSESLTKREQEVLALLKKGITQTDVGNRLGISQQSVNQAINRIRLKWRKVNGED